MLKSLSIKFKLVILIIVPVIAAIGITAIALTNVNTISASLTQNLYSEGFKSIALVLNADRDLYQALENVDALLLQNSKGTLTPAAKEEYLAGFEENQVQTSDRVKEAVDLLSQNKGFWDNIKDDSGLTIFDHYTAFEESYTAWVSMSGTVMSTYASSDEWVSQFDNAREHMNVIGELVEVGVQNSIVANEADKTSMVRTILIIDAVVLLLVLGLSILIISAIVGPLKKNRRNASGYGSRQVERTTESGSERRNRSDGSFAGSIC